MSDQPTEQLDRRAYIGGSDIAAIMGMGASYRGVQATPFTVWQRKMGEVSEPMDAATELFLRRRKRWEGPIFEMLREEFSAEIVAINQRYRDEEHPFFACELDFEWRDPETGEINNGEVKTVSPFAYGERFGWGEAGTSDIPVNYAAQVMWGLGIKKRRVCIVPAMVGLDNMIFYRVERDDETIAAMRAEALRFWNEHVLTRIPPDPQTMMDLNAQMLRKRGRPVELDDAMAEKLKRLKIIRNDIAAFELEEVSLAFDVGNYVLKRWNAPLDQVGANQEDALIRHDGLTLATWKKQRKETIDAKRLRVELPDVAAKFTRETVFRVLRFIKPKP
jgi:predicted phage-related endonuclease